MARSNKSSRPVRYAVVGLGHIAQIAVLPAFEHAENAQVTALVSDDPVKLEEVGKKYQAEGRYSYEEYERCLRSGTVDAVYIALPNHLHREYTERAARAGIHVLCEKPMAPTVEDCEAMIRAASEGGVKLMIAYRLHFEKSNLEAIRMVQEKELGEPRIFDSVFCQQVVAENIRLAYEERQGGGPVYDMGVYCINAARYLFRDEPVEVFAWSANNGEPRFHRADEMTSVVMRFPKQRMATFTCSFGAARTDSLTLVGTKGTLCSEPAFEYAGKIVHKITIDESTRQRRYSKRDQFAAELVYFSDCILSNRTPEPSGEEGLADVRVVRAVYESIQDGRPVRLGPFARAQRPSMEQEIHRPPVSEPHVVHATGPSGE